MTTPIKPETFVIIKKQPEKLRARLIRNFKRHFLTRLNYFTRPSFIIIGAPKSGTTSLFYWLAQHPHLVPSYGKEIHFFDRNNFYHSGGYRWYHSNFPLPHQLGRSRMTFEASPGYMANVEVPERIHRYNPSIRLILIMRNPVDRAYSWWNNWPQQNMTFSEFVVQALDRIRQYGVQYPATSLGEECLTDGIYIDHIQRYLTYFSRGQLLCLDYKVLKESPAQLLCEVETFIGLEHHNWNSADLTSWNWNKYEPILPETRKSLETFYAPYNEKLFDFLGVDYGW